MRLNRRVISMDIYIILWIEHIAGWYIKYVLYNSRLYHHFIYDFPHQSTKTNVYYWEL